MGTKSNQETTSVINSEGDHELVTLPLVEEQVGARDKALGEAVCSRPLDGKEHLNCNPALSLPIRPALEASNQEPEANKEDVIEATNVECPPAPMALTENKTQFALDWSKPVYLVSPGCPATMTRLQRPAVSLFRLSQIEAATARGARDLALVMLRVLAASRHDPRYTTRKSAKFLSLCQDLGLCTESQSSTTPHKKLLRSASTMPTSPELSIPEPSEHLWRTPESPNDDQETQRLQAEVEDVIRRTPALQKVTPPQRSAIIDRAATAIKDSSFFQRLQPTSSTRRKDPTADVSNSGSAYLYALVTPGKKLREILDSSSAVSPVRRSRRIMNHVGPTGSSGLYEQLTDVPDLAAHGFIPNSSISTQLSDFKDHVRPKRDPAEIKESSLTSQRSRPPLPETENGDQSPFL